MESILQSMEAHPVAATLLAIFILFSLGIIGDIIADIIRIFKR
jgi:hypothetical protein